MSALVAACSNLVQASVAYPDGVVMLAVAASGGTLLMERLIKKLYSTTDLKTVLTYLEDWMRKLQQTLRDVVERLCRQFPDEGARNAYLQNLAMCPTEEMDTRWDT